MLSYCPFGVSQQLMRSYYDYQKTQKKEEYYVNAKGEKNGAYKAFDENGILNGQCTFKNGLMDGACIEYNTSTGRQLPSQTETYKDGNKNGPAVYYNGNGIIYRQGSYKDEKKDGLWMRIDGSQNCGVRQFYKFTEEEEKTCKYIKYNVMYKNDEEIKYDGKQAITYYPSGKPYEESTYLNGRKIDDEFSYYPNGTKLAYVKYKDGDYLLRKIWYSDGKLKESSSWETGKKVYEGYNPDGTPDSDMVQEKQANEEKEKSKESMKYKPTGDSAVFADNFDLANQYYSKLFYQSDIDRLKNRSENVKQAQTAFKKKNYQEALNWYDKALSLKDDVFNAQIDERIAKIKALMSAQESQEKTIKAFPELITSKHQAFEKLYVEQKVIPFIVDEKGQPKYRNSYLKGKHIYEKSERVYQEDLKTFNSENDNEKKVAVGTGIVKLLDKLISIAASETKDLDKQLKQAETSEEIKKILGI